jgi:hypothetical protein
MKKNILMLDDDLVPLSEGITEERVRLQPWLRWLKTGKQAENFNLIECNSLENFMNELIKRPIDPHDDRYIHALIIDVMWKKTTTIAGDFSSINYSDVKVFPLEAGAQLLRLMFAADSNASPILLAHKTRPIAVLSSLHGLEIPLGELPKNVNIMRKTTFEIQDSPTGEFINTPSNDFQEWVNNLKTSSDE